ncbi:endonuclease-reverse transcriptase [Plakobranchus ocellatus]|uniref:Endonuclease-reverse transcriptase n=1 Tax=Plakobranchus ocellatus TaxID=259542 RepID=A0AAV4AYA4_9GAST|nr:endonuclease-reverse transcriptase [Plakobranchus ocellatus]
MWFIRRMMRISWTEKKSNEVVLKQANLERSLIKTIRQRQLQFLGHICRHKGLEHLRITRKIGGKRNRGRQRIAFIENLKSWAIDKGSNNKFISSDLETNPWEMMNFLVWVLIVYCATETVYADAEEQCLHRTRDMPASVGDTLEFSLCFSKNFTASSVSMETTYGHNGSKCSLNSASCFNKFFISSDRSSPDGKQRLKVKVKIESPDDFTNRILRFHGESKNSSEIFDLDIYRDVETVADCDLDYQYSPALVGDVLSFKICITLIELVEKIVELTIIPTIDSCKPNSWCDDTIFWTSKSVNLTILVTVNFKVKSILDYNLHRLKFRSAKGTVVAAHSIDIYKPDIEEPCSHELQGRSAKLGDTLEFSLCFMQQFYKSFAFVTLTSGSASTKCLLNNATCSTKFYALSDKSSHPGREKIMVRFNVTSISDFGKHSLTFQYQFKDYVTRTDFDIYKAVETSYDCEKNHLNIAAHLNDLLSFQLCLKDTNLTDSTMRFNLADQLSPCRPNYWCSEGLFWTFTTTGRKSIVTINFRVRSVADYRHHVLGFLDVKDATIAKASFDISLPGRYCSQRYTYMSMMLKRQCNSSFSYVQQLYVYKR